MVRAEERQRAVVGEDQPHRPTSQQQHSLGGRVGRPGLAVEQGEHQSGAERETRVEQVEPAQAENAAVHQHPPDRGPQRDPQGRCDREQRDRQPHPVRRNRGPERRQHYPGVAELETYQRRPDGELVDVLAHRQDQENDRLDVRTPGDHCLAAVLLRPDSPERDQWQAHDVGQRAEDPGPARHVTGGGAEVDQVKRQEAAEMPEAEGLHQRRDGEECQYQLPGLASLTPQQLRFSGVLVAAGRRLCKGACCSHCTGEHRTTVAAAHSSVK